MDYAASTPVDRKVKKAMAPYFDRDFANPSSLHWFGQQASRGIFEARRKIAESIGADYKNIIFTGSATEANNLAIRSSSKKGKIIISAIEHESISEAAPGARVISVDRDGFVDLKKLKSALNEKTALVSIMYANNEVGSIQSISEIANLIRDFKETRNRKQGVSDLYPLFHSDAVQAFQYLDCNVDELGVDLMTISAHKIYGPKGIGAFYIRNPKILRPIIFGSGQEQGLRSGTENTSSIVGFGEAAKIGSRMRQKEAKRVGALRNYFWQNLKKRLPKIQLNGSLLNRLPNNLNIYFPGKDAHELQIKLDLMGVAASPGAACSSRVSKTSFILEAMRLSKERATESLRFTLGRPTTKREIDQTIAAICKAVI